MCSNATAGIGSTPFIFVGGVPGGSGNTNTCFRTVFASSYNSSLCQPSVRCIGSTLGPRKRKHKSNFAPAFIATNWWKSGDNQGTARCIDSVTEDQNVESMVTSINNGPVLPNARTNEILSKLEGLIASL